MSDDQLIGQQLNEYRLEKLLGQGGMARVYRGLDVGLKRYAAIKVIDTPFQRDEEYLRRFEVEAQAIAQLDHPNIVSLYRYGQAEDVLYMAMKYVEGADLHAILSGYEDSGDFMPWEEVLRVMREVSSALDYAHNKGVVHRDIKPSNIMIDEQGRAYLTDFGLALLTAQGTQGQIFGTPQYIAPEQAISSAGAVPQSDFYAIGVILYRMMTGVLPFDHDDLLEIAMLHMTEPPTPPRAHRPDITPDVEAVILKCLAKEPEARYVNGAEFVAALEQVGNKVVAPMSVPALSIMERVALDMERLPPPPPLTDGSNAAIAPQSIPTPPPVPSPERVVVEPEPTELPTDTGLPVSPKLLGIGGILLLLLLLGGGYFLSGRGDGDDDDSDTAVAELITSEDDISPNDTSPAEDSPPLAENVVDENEGEGEGAEGSGETAVMDPTDSPEENNSEIPVIDENDSEDVFLPMVASSGSENTNTEDNTTATTPPTNTPVPQPTAAPTATPEPALNIYQIFVERDKDTLFLTNTSDIPIAMTSIVFAFKGDEQLSSWPTATLQPNNCILIVKEDKTVSNKVEETACEQVVNTLEFDWKDDFDVTFAGTEIGSCKVKGNNGDCQLEWIVP